MATAIQLPELGAARGSVRVSVWLAEPGDRVDEGDRLVELLTPGITFDLPSPATGVLSRIEAGVDATVAPGDVLGWIDEEADEAE